MKADQKFYQIVWDDLDVPTQNSIATKLAMEACKHLPTPAVNDPCADMESMMESIVNHLMIDNPTICELDLQELGEESGILK